MIGPVPSRVSAAASIASLRRRRVVLMSSFRDDCHRQALAVRAFQAAGGLRNVRSSENGIETHS
jgi:hypothetical protein